MLGLLWYLPMMHYGSKLIKMHHDSPLGGHFGMYRTMSALHLQYWWPGMQGDVRGYIRRCVVCQQAKVVTQKPQGLL